MIKAVRIEDLSDYDKELIEDFYQWLKRQERNQKQKLR